MSSVKHCPDCAEPLRGEARLCRYCGFRFSRRYTALTLFGDAISGLRGSSRPTLPEILSEWGLTLGADEEVMFFLPADVDGEAGYLLVTVARLVFFVQVCRSKYDKRHEHRLASIAEVGRFGQPAGGRIRVAGAGYVHLVRGHIRGDVPRLSGFLSRVVRADGTTPRPQAPG